MSDPIESPTPLCGHCGAAAKGYAKVGDVRLCHPDEGLECYRLVTVYGHSVPCQGCGESDVAIAEQMLPAGYEVLVRDVPYEPERVAAQRPGEAGSKNASKEDVIDV